MHPSSTLVLLSALGLVASSQVFNMAVYSNRLSLARRDGSSAYQPEVAVCKEGMNSCEEACGAGFEQCPGAKGDEAHCVNRLRNESCCMGGHGQSCAAGFYCTVDNTGNNICCPEGQDLSACANEQKVAGQLQYATSTPPSSTPPTPPPPPPTTTPVPTPAAPTTTMMMASTTMMKNTTPLSTYQLVNTTTIASTIYLSPISSSASCTTPPFGALNSTVAKSTLASQAPFAAAPPQSPTGLTSRAVAHAPVGASMLVVVAALFALL
ncbi:hypothetical protein L249_3745 [Ophiocordyceps polyrhachis-furcata BCC 54312]|uniref:Uncharacterized protein n=1 Tax=Ophiocordyceps polyrhachis-furcata BCC 54312 TaxID=1330021 RepID=A0A367L4I9_9HYPO|nr:hypothetical protein L249_3745 [Ophiocordyceps polyrhachis-furcata BCC 54312]